MRAGARRLEKMPLGAMLRLGWHEARRHMLADLRASGFTELDDAHLLVFQYPGPDGLRPSDLSRRMRTSRQATNYLLVQLESLGYVERRASAAPARRRIRLTASGLRVQTAMRSSMRRFERRWRRRAGASRYRTFVDVLDAIVHQRADAVARRRRQG